MINKKLTRLLPVKMVPATSYYVNHPWSASFICDSNKNGFFKGSREKRVHRIKIHVALTKRTHQEVVDSEDETYEVTPQELKTPFTEKIPKSFITVNKFDKPYNIHAPAGNMKSPNKPALQEEEIQQFKQFASIYTSNVISGTPETRREYAKLMNEQRLNKSLKVKASHYDKALAITRIESMDKLEEFIGDIKPKDTFTKFLKYAASDYYLNCLRAAPYSISDERTIYCEVVIPLFKLFGNIAGRFKYSSYATFTKVHVFTIHVIQDKMSLTRYSYNDSKKFDIVEARSCELPLTFKDKKKFLKLMEFFSFLYHDLQEQSSVFDQLDDERNGIIDVEELDMVKNVLR